MIADAYAALVAGDGRIATSCEAVEGGVRLRMPELPDIRDNNAAVLAPGADRALVAGLLAADPQLRRVIAFGPAEDLAVDGWDAQPMLVMARDGEAPDWPAGVARVDVAVLRAARAEALAGFPAGEREQMRALQERQAAVGTLVAVLREGRALAWAQVLAGVVDDVFVVPEARGTGLGRAVVRAAMSAGGRFLVVDEANDVALGLYRSLGFADAGRLLELTRAG